jgi:hypothetical protein
MGETDGQPAGSALAERPEPLDAVKRLLVGRPRASAEIGETLLSKKLALPIFASDPLSSVAYATEAALVVLVAASATAAHLVIPVSIAIAAVLGIVVLSYTQTVRRTRRAGAPTSLPRKTSGRCRAWSPQRLSSSTTS